MWCLFVSMLLLVSCRTINCDLELKILRIIDENYSLVNVLVDERSGNNLSLSCELHSAGKDYDDRITWGKASNNLSFQNETDLETLARQNSNKLASLVRPSEVNRAQLNFQPLRTDDEGTYFCGSLKFTLFKVIYIAVRNQSSKRLETSNVYKTNYLGDVNGRENFYCSEKMFKCKLGGACIQPHYVCDKKPDCTDGSDESYETCKGDPCKGKLECSDGRCIPMNWCCDKHHDSNCNVTYPPHCCQLLSESYEEEYAYIPYNKTQVPPHTTRYIFITLCISATFFSIILMLLIFSKVFIFAKKTSRTPRDLYQLNEHNFNYRARNVVRYTTTECNALTTDGAVDALLILSDDILRDGGDRPPSYSDVVGQMEAPPPYTSQDCLNR